jgi:hypothetical protein
MTKLECSLLYIQNQKVHVLPRNFTPRKQFQLTLSCLNDLGWKRPGLVAVGLYLDLAQQDGKHAAAACVELCLPGCQAALFVHATIVSS